VEIARRANYDREHGVPDALDANNPIQPAESRLCTTRNSYDVPNTTKTTTLLMTFTSSRQLMLHQQAREWLLITQHSHYLIGSRIRRYTVACDLIGSSTCDTRQIYYKDCVT
jgi:hypothetical protein